MRINTNVSALTSSRNVFLNNMNARSSMAKLSSGMRISQASDDAAGLSIANKLRTQARSLNQAATNAEQGRAMLQIAEGAAQTVQGFVERQKELMVQRDQTATNSSVTATLAAEITSLQTEADRVVAEANFQGSSVFGSLVFQVSDRASNGTVTIDASLALVTLTGASTLARIGVGQNVLDYTTRNLKSAVVNVKAAESTIRDVDMAEEMANFTRSNILMQAAQSMLSQANQSSQSILNILR
jgi:flagellin